MWIISRFQIIKLQRQGNAKLPSGSCRIVYEKQDTDELRSEEQGRCLALHVAVDVMGIGQPECKTPSQNTQMAWNVGGERQRRTQEANVRDERQGRTKGEEKR